MRRKREINLKKLAVMRKINAEYSSLSVNKLVNNIMSCGKKQKALNIVIRSLNEVKRILNMQFMDDSIAVLDEAIKKASPDYKLSNTKRPGSLSREYCETSEEEKWGKAIKRIVRCARERKDHDENGRKLSMWAKLAREIVETREGSSATMKMKDNDRKSAISSLSISSARYSSN